jgi:hypothetical protein
MSQHFAFSFTTPQMTLALKPVPRLLEAGINGKKQDEAQAKQHDLDLHIGPVAPKRVCWD